VVESDEVDLRSPEARSEQRADLGGERHPPAVAAPVEGLDAELIPSGHEPPAGGVPKREREDSVQPSHAVEPVLLVGVHHDLAV
jgi:hypothetical protein